jgi:hypothetical protein
MQHEIYSLGVCLLEIGLWQSLTVFEDDEEVPSHELEGLIRISKARGLADPWVCKESLVQIAHRKLPSRMGDKYTAVVVNCLTCLDEDNIDFGDQSEFEDKDGILVGVRFIEKVCTPDE